MTLAYPQPLFAERQPGLVWSLGSLAEANYLLATSHYLGPVRSGRVEVVLVGYLDGLPIAAQVWKRPTSRRLPNCGAWLELSRWCLTPAAGPNAGSRQHRAALPYLRALGARTLVSYSDPSAGHTGALYRACNWTWAPTWQRLRRPPSGGGAWSPGHQQEPKDRWVFHLTRRDPERVRLAITDRGAVRHWLKNATAAELSWARRSGYVQDALHLLGVTP